MFHENEIQFRIQHVQLDQSKCSPYLLMLFEIIFLCLDVVKAKCTSASMQNWRIHQNIFLRKKWELRSIWWFPTDNSFDNPFEYTIQASVYLCSLHSPCMWYAMDTSSFDYIVYCFIEEITDYYYATQYFIFCTVFFYFSCKSSVHFQFPNLAKYN